MPVFRLSDEYIFPPVEYANEMGILAIGGDLMPERLLTAYTAGVFPWYSKNEPILWWSPDPRFVIFPKEIIISKSMKKVIKKHVFDIKADTAFDKVIQHCSVIPRKRQKGTWITEEMINAYIMLNRLGFAHSIEAWKDDELVGGLYGVSLGGMFFGESMFSFEDNASKAALIALADKLIQMKFELIDSQVYTPHLETLGGMNISRESYISILKTSLKKKTITGSWTHIF